MRWTDVSYRVKRYVISGLRSFLTMSPYSKALRPISDIAPYFQKNPKDFSMTFIGESLEVRIPLSFKKHGSLEISDVVTTIGVCDLIIDETYHVALNILAQITIEPSDFKYMTYQGIDYLVLTLQKGDKFMSSYRVVQDQHVIYVLWTDFVTSGKLPYWYDYKSLLKIFRHAVKLTGSGIGVSQSVFAGIIGHLARDKNKITVQYRLTDMTKPMRWIALNAISSASSSTVARLNGSYFRDTLTSALRIEVDQQQPFENLLRGISSSAIDGDPDHAFT